MIWHRVRAQEADPMMYDKFFADAISRLRDERRYRVFSDLERINDKGGIRHQFHQQAELPRCESHATSLVMPKTSLSHTETV